MNASFTSVPRSDAALMLLVPCALGLEDLLADEFVRLGLRRPIARPGAVFVTGPLSNSERMRCALVVCLKSRLASRVLWPLTRFGCESRADFEAASSTVAFEDHLPEGATFAVRCPRGYGELSHTHFAALCLKDAIVDRLRAMRGGRPDVDADRPDVLFDLRFIDGDAIISVDVAGHSLHERHRRPHGSLAPIKENLAAAVLLRSELGLESPNPPPLIDPLCGSGTLLIEAALMAIGQAPGLLRNPPSPKWQPFDANLWQDLVDAAQEASVRGRAALRASGWKALGIDIDPRQLTTARRHIAQLSLEDFIELKEGRAEELSAHLPEQPGHIVTNLPYGHRLGDPKEVRALFRRLGVAWAPLAGWQAHLLIGEQELGFALGLRAHKRHRLYNGALATTLLHVSLGQKLRTASVEGTELRKRLEKNLRRLRGQLKYDEPFRLYDADIPQFAAAIDVWPPADDPKEPFIVVQEYAPPRDIPADKARRRMREVRDALTELFAIEPTHVIEKVRRPVKGGHRLDEANEDAPRFWVHEAGLHLWIQLGGSLDCGLFVDHRPVRHKLRRLANDKDLLNLFGYTGSLTCAAVLGGARSSETVDLSRTYLDWAAHNLAANNADMTQHRLVHADVMAYLRQQEQQGARFDIALINPPSFSNSKRAEEDFDVWRDHAELVRRTMALVRKDGWALLSSHAQKLVLSEEIARTFVVQEVHDWVRPIDFQRPHRGAKAYRIAHAP